MTTLDDIIEASRSHEPRIADIEHRLERMTLSVADIYMISVGRATSTTWRVDQVGLTTLTESAHRVQQRWFCRDMARRVAAR